MKAIVYGEVVNGELEIDIDEISDVENVRYDIEDLSGVFYFQMIYKDIILNDKMREFRFNDNPKIWIGNLENYLEKFPESVILEIFIVKEISSVAHIIANRTEQLNSVKSTIQCVTENISRIFNVASKSEIDCKQTVNDIEQNSEFKLIISTCEDSSFDDCIKGHDEYLIRNYISCNDLTFIWYRNDFKQYHIEALKEMLCVARTISGSPEPTLDKNLDSLPQSFLNCRFFFCQAITDRICEICNYRYWKRNFHRRKYDEIVSSVFRQFFHDALMNEVLEFINDRLHNPLHVGEKSMRDLVIQALDHCNNYLDYPSKEWRYLIQRFLSDFSFKRHINNSEIDGVIKKWIEDHSRIVIELS